MYISPTPACNYGDVGQAPTPKECRVLIDYKSGYYWHYSTRDKFEHVTRPLVKMKRDLISVGCTDVTPSVLRELLKTYDLNFKSEDKEVVIQP